MIQAFSCDVSLYKVCQFFSQDHLNFTNLKLYLQLNDMCEETLI